MNFDFIDEAITAEPPRLGSPDQREEELLQLMDLAANVGSYKWQYDGDEDVHDGIITQDLLKVPGLKDAVHIDEETGLQSVDANFLALAAIGYISALARYIFDKEKAEKADEPLAPFVNKEEL